MGPERRQQLADALASVRYTLEDGIYLLGRPFKLVARRLRSRPPGPPGERRRLRLAGLGLLGLVALVALAVSPLAPCGLPGGEDCEPRDEAAKLIPAGALVYFHANLDRSTDQALLAGELGEQIPALSGELSRLALASIPGLGGDLYRERGDWFEGEVAVALLPAGAGKGGSRTLTLFEGDGAGAEEFAAELAGGPRSADHDGVRVIGTADRAGAMVGGFVVVGPRSAVKRVIDTERGEVAALADDGEIEGLRARLPSERLADLYLAPAGARRVLEPGRSPLAFLEPFVNPARTTGAVAALSLAGERVELSIRSAQRPRADGRIGGFFGSFEPFSPQLARRISANAFAYLGLGKPAEGVEELIDQAADDAPGIVAGIEGLTRQLRRQGGVDLAEEVLPLLGEEAALVVSPRRRARAGAVPYVALLTRGIEPRAARADLAKLQRPLGRLFGTSGSFSEAQIAGAPAQTVQASPTVELAYAAFDDLLVIGTRPAAIVAARRGEHLADSERFRSASEALGIEPVALLYADLAGLVGLGESAGLGEDLAYALFAPELRSLEALALLVGHQGSVLATDARLVLGPGQG